MALTDQEELELLELEEKEYQYQKAQRTTGANPGDLAKKFAQGASFGFLPRVAGALEAGGQAVGLKGLGGTDFTDIEFQKPKILEPQALGEAYESAKTGYEKALDVASERSPVGSAISELAGGFATPNPYSKIQALKNAGLAGRTAAGGLMGATAGVGYSRDLEEIPGRAAIGATLGAAAPVIAEKAIAPGVKAAGKGIGKLKEILGNFGEQFKTMPKPDAEDITQASRALGFEPSKAMLSQGKPVQALEEGLVKSGGLFSGDVIKQSQKMQEGIKKGLEAVESKASGASFETAGRSMDQALNKTLAEMDEPIKAAYKAVEKPLQKIPMNEGLINKTMGVLRRNDMFRSDEGAKFLEKIQRETKELSSVKSLNQYISDLYKMRSPLSSGREDALIDASYGALKELRDNTIFNAQGLSGAVKNEIIDSITTAEKLFSDQITDINQIRSVLGASGKEFKSPIGFKEALADKSFESLGKSAGQTPSEVMAYMKQKFPDAFNVAREARVNDLIQKSMTKGEVDLGKLIRNYQKITPEARALVFEPDELSQLENLTKVYNAMPAPQNPSGTSHMTRMWETFKHPIDKGVADYLANKALKEAGPDGSPFLNTLVDKLGEKQKAFQPGGGVYEAPFKTLEAIPRNIQPAIQYDKKDKKSDSPDTSMILEKVKGTEFEDVLKKALSKSKESFAAANYVLGSRNRKYQDLIAGDGDSKS